MATSKTPSKARKAATGKKKPDNRTVVQKRRFEYQEKQREYLRGLGLVREVVNDIKGCHTDAELPLVKWRNETRLKLLNKILPDLKQTEISNAPGETFKTEAEIRGPLVEAAAELGRKLRGV